ncbi:MAG: response regulator [Candidatus Latescibacterota bacterium]|nr:MAG: response regulator [Candidatus Latescibacterota bacterium]
METVLVVDDSPKDRDIAGACLKEHGLTPMFAENGREALEVLERRRPDAVLTGLYMPEMDGLKLVEFMRRDHSSIPVVLMTARGSEDTAVAALRAGALSYVPKKNLRTNLCDAMRVVLGAVEAKRHREQVRKFLERTESHFVLGYELEGPIALVSHLQSNLAQINFCDETGLFQVGTALSEAFNNAIDHGNLELDSSLREKSGEAYAKLRQERAQQLPYRDRRVHVTERLAQPEVTYVVRDDGQGFDLSTVPDPRNLRNILKASGRGLMLIRMFMDEVTFNDTGNEIRMVKQRADSSIPSRVGSS